MITRLEVDGFKSLREFAVDLEPFTVFVGPNGAGKSNVIEALALLSRLGDGRMTPEAALQAGRGRALDQFLRHGGEIARSITIGAEALVISQEHDEDEVTQWADRLLYRVSLTRQVAKSGERITFEHHAERIPTSSDPWMERHPEWSEYVVPSDVHHQQKYGWRPHLDFRVLQLETSQMREPSERIDPGSLASDAHNLPSVLASLSDPTLTEIRSELVSLIPGLADFRVLERDEAFQIEFLTRDGDAIPARLASDGTLRMLAVLTAVLGVPDWSTTICVEEPENGIFPGRLRRLIDLLRDVTSSDAWRSGESDVMSPQVIVTTHSPIFLTALRDHPECLRYVDLVRKDRRLVTRARPLATTGAHEPGTHVTFAEIEAVLGGAVSLEDDR